MYFRSITLRPWKYCSNQAHDRGPIDHREVIPALYPSARFISGTYSLGYMSLGIYFPNILVNLFTTHIVFCRNIEP